MTQLYIHTFFFIFFSVMACHRVWNIAPCGIQQTLLYIYPIYNSLHLLMPNSQSFLPLPPAPLGNHKSGEHRFLWGSQCCLYQTLDQNLYEQVKSSSSVKSGNLDSSCGFSSGKSLCLYIIHLSNFPSE